MSTSILLGLASISARKLGFGSTVLIFGAGNATPMTWIPSIDSPFLVDLVYGDLGRSIVVFGGMLAISDIDPI